MYVYYIFDIFINKHKSNNYKSQISLGTQQVRKGGPKFRGRRGGRKGEFLHFSTGLMFSPAYGATRGKKDTTNRSHGVWSRNLGKLKEVETTVKRKTEYSPPRDTFWRGNSFEVFNAKTRSCREKRSMQRMFILDRNQ